jgi:hypothetical protein
MVGTRRVWLLVNLAVTVALVPALFIGTEHAPTAAVAVTAGETLRTLPVVATATPGSNHVVVLGPSVIAAQATTTAPPPTTVVHHVAPKAVVRAPATRARSTPATRPRSTPATTAKPRPATPRTTTVPSPDRTEAGKGTWYDHQPGVCAHKSLPFGTVVTVTDTANGKSVTCVVGDRGPYVDGYVIDLNPREFEQLAPRSTGVIPVRLSW